LVNGQAWSTFSASADQPFATVGFWSSPGVRVFEFATTQLSFGHRMQGPVSGVQFEFL
jgi:hypothetical protein